MVALDLEVFNEQSSAAAGAAYYPWDYLAELPRRRRCGRCTGLWPAPAYNWTIVLRRNKTTALRASEGQPDSFGDDDYTETVAQHTTRNKTITHVFDTAGKFYDVRLAGGGARRGREPARSSARTAPRTRVKLAAVVCKYVRELRKLTDDDRTLYFEALTMIYTLDDSEGAQLYGGNFRTGNYFTRQHLAAMSIEGCTPWHTGTVFLTSHAAMTREFEMALQSVAPVLAAPYWEYTLDSTRYGGAWSKNSPIFSDDFFGDFPTEARSSSRRAAASRASRRSAPTCGTRPSTRRGATSWTTSRATRPTTSRAPRRCAGLPTTAPLPTCSKMRLAADQTSNFAFREYVETFYHAELHPLIGGAWDCKYGNVKTLIDEFPARIASYAEDILTHLGVLMRYAYAVQKNFSQGVLVPGMAGFSTEWGDVRCPQNCAQPKSMSNNDDNST